MITTEEEDKSAVPEGEGDGTSRQSGKDDADDGDSDEAEFQYRVYYRKDEIRMTKDK